MIEHYDHDDYVGDDDEIEPIYNMHSLSPQSKGTAESKQKSALHCKARVMMVVMKWLKWNDGSNAAEGGDADILYAYLALNPQLNLIIFYRSGSLKVLSII